MKKIYILLLLIIVFWVSIGCQPKWAIHFGGASSDTAKSIQQTQDGGYIIAGQGGAYGGYLITKFSSDGTVTWQKEYVLDGIFDTAQSIKQTRDGGYIVVGMSSSFYDDKIWILKLNELGEIEWQKQTLYEDNSSFTARAYSVKETFDQAGPEGNPNGYIITGSTIHLTDPSWCIWVLKIDLGGTFEWQKTYSGATSGAYSVDQTFDQDGIQDGFIVAGSSGSDAWILRLNLDGSINWERMYYGSSTNANSIQQTHDGGFIVAGPGEGNDPDLAPGSHFWVAKLYANGLIEWQKLYGGQDDQDVPFSIDEVIDSKGLSNGYVVAGETSNFGAGQKDVWVLKLDLNGSIEWQKTYGGDLDENANSIQQTFDLAGNPSGYALAGYTWSFGTGQDAFVLKLNSNGEIPDCEIMGTSEAIVKEGEYWFEPSPDTTPQVSGATLQVTDIELVTPDYTAEQICYRSPQ